MKKIVLTLSLALLSLCLHATVIYEQDFEDFVFDTGTEVTTFGDNDEWTFAATGTHSQRLTYNGDWGSGTITGFRGNDFVMGYQHSGTSGVFTATLTVTNNTGEVISDLYISYMGRVERVSEGRSPKWTVYVDGIEIPDLFYSTSVGEDQTKSAVIGDVNIGVGETFTIEWSSDRGQPTGSSKQIGIADVLIDISEVNQVAIPTFSPPAGTYTEPVDVEISTTTENATIHYTLDGTDPDQTSPIYTEPINIDETTTVKARAYKEDYLPSLIATAEYQMPTFVEDLAALRDSPHGELYTVTGEVILTFQQDFRNNKFVQDDTAAILIDDDPGIITTTYERGDGITNLTGTLGEYGNMLQFNPTIDPGAPTSTGNVIEPTVLTIDQMNTNFMNYQAQVVTIENANFTDTGSFANGLVYGISDDSGNGEFRTTFYGVDYIGDPIPQEPLHLTGILNSRSEGDYITSRDWDDMEILDGPVATPTFIPEPGLYTEATDVSIVTDTEDATIMYRTSTDGGAWTDWETYTDAITVPLDTEMDFEAYAEKDDWITSQTVSANYIVTGTVADPTFSPDPVIYTEATDVEIDTATDGATIMYRTSTEGGAWTDWETYTDPITVPLNTEMDFEAYAEKDDWITSETVSANYIVTGTVADPTFSPDPGIYTEATDVSIETDTEDATIMYRTSTEGGAWTDWQVYTDPITVPLDTEMDFEAYAEKDDWITSETISANYIVTGTVTGTVATPTFSPDPGIYTEATDVEIDTATYGATIMYRTSTDSGAWTDWETYTDAIEVPLYTEMDFEAYAQKDDWADSDTAEATYTVTGTVAMPTFSPDPGIYTEATDVEIDTATEGATIKYRTSTDGGTWTAWETYTDPITVPLDTEMDFEAYAEKTDWADSDTAEASYIVTGTVATPTFSPDSGIYTETTDVEIDTATEGATIKYRTSTDGGAWTAWETYTDPITVPLDTEMDFEAYAEKTDWADSDTAEASYIVTGTVATPIFSPDSGIYTEATDVEIDTATEGATIMYRISTDGGAWTDWETYTDAITVSLDTEMDFEAYAQKDDWLDSDTAEATYTITGTVAMPTFSPEPGLYTEATDVSIETDTEGATIMYRTSTAGTLRDTWSDWQEYIDPITVPLNTEMDFEAYAQKDDWADSDIAEATYTVTGTVAMPTFLPEPGLYTEATAVSIDTDTDGATIMYRTSTDGGAWTDWETYTDAITVSLDTEMDFEAYAEKTDWADSDTSEASYIVTGTVATPEFDPEGGVYHEVQVVTISTETPGATIEYSYDGESWIEGDTAEIEYSTMLYARAFLENWADSEIAEDMYYILHPPQDLVSEAGDGYVDLVWQAPIGTRANSRNNSPRLSEQESSREEHGVIGYNIYRDEELITSVGLVQNYHDDEVQNTVEYTYYVTAIYPEGESLPSNTTTAVPMPDIAYGDVDDNGVVEAYDAALVLQYAVGMDPIPQIDPRPWEDWRFIRADVNGDDMIRAYDASLILQYALGIISVFPVQIPVRYQQPEIVDIGWFIDDEYLYLNTDNSEALYAAEFIIPDSENISFGEVEFNTQLSEYIMIALTKEEGTHVALAAAIPIEHSDYLFRIPYQSEGYEILTIDIISNIYESSLEIEFLPTETDEPVEFTTSLHRAFPNPFNPETNIGFSLADAGHVTIEIFNIRGQKVRTLVNEPYEAGEHNVVWDGRDDKDREVSGGVYLYRFISRDHIETRRMLLLK